MKINIEKFAIVILTVALLGMFSVMQTSNLMASSGSTQGVGYVGMVCREITRADGTFEDLGCNKNTLINKGKNYTTSQLTSTPDTADASDIISTIQLGNTSAPNAEDTTFQGVIGDCGLAEYTTLTWISQKNNTGYSNGNVSTNYEWTSTCNSVVVNQTALVSADDDHYFAGNSFTDVTLQINDQLNVTWYVWVT